MTCAPSTAALLTLLALAACGEAGADQEARSGEKTAPDAAATRVEVARIQPSEAAIHVGVPGEVYGSRDASLAAPMGGYVEAVRVSDGDRVAAGQVIAQVDASIRAAGLRQAEAQLALAEAELERVRQLGDLATASQLQGAETQAVVARAARDMAAAQLSRAVITAPFPGVVSNIDIEVGEFAAPGQPVARLLQLDPVTVTVTVPDRDVVSLREGMSAQVTTTATSGVLTGTVRHISPAADLRTRAFPVDITVPNPDGQLRPGMIARVDVQISRGEPALVIPQDWLVTRTADQGVFVAEDQHARWRTLKLGAILRDQVVIDEGLEPGELIVITGHRELVDGDELIISREGRCCTDGRATFAGADGSEG